MRKTIRFLLVLVITCVIVNTCYAEQSAFVRWGRPNIASGVNIRSGPSVNYEIVGKLMPRYAVKVFSIDSDGWYEILYRGKKCYVFSNYIDTWEQSKYKCVGRYKTFFDTSNKNRNHNINLASKGINIRILPGEYFRWSKIIGPASKEQGYLLGNVIIGDKMEQDYGGGVCQVSSTLYNAALEAGLEIVERHTHGLPVNYVPPGRDATVSYGFLDFVFKNNKSYELQINAFAGNGFVEVSIYNITPMVRKKNMKEVIVTKIKPSKNNNKKQTLM